MVWGHEAIVQVPWVPGTFSLKVPICLSGPDVLLGQKQGALKFGDSKERTGKPRSSLSIHCSF